MKLSSDRGDIWEGLLGLLGLLLFIAVLVWFCTDFPTPP